MSRRPCKRVSFSPDPEANEEPIYPTHKGLSSSRHGRQRVLVRILSLDVGTSPAARRLLRRVGARVSKTLRFMSFGRKSTNTETVPSSSSSSRNVSASSSLSCSSSSYSSSSIYLVKSKSLNESESHRAEAIEDCIEFLNSSSSSSSLSRSSSLSALSC